MYKKRCPYCMNLLKEKDTICDYCKKDIDECLNPDYALAVGTLLEGVDEYQIGKYLNKGGFGISYLAWDNKRDRKVAIKECFPNGLVTRAEDKKNVNGSDESRFNLIKKKFEEEAEILKRIPNDSKTVVQIYDHFKYFNTVYLVLEYIDGETLNDYRRKENNTIRYDDAIKLLEDIIDALCIIHKAKVIHGDVSPSNIMISSGKAKLLDFGAVRLVSVDSQEDKTHAINTTLNMFKKGYSPFEFYSDPDSCDERSDVYSLAATIYYLLTGVEIDNCLDRQFNDCVLPPSSFNPTITEMQDSVILKGMAISCSDRFETMEKFKEELINAKTSEIKNDSNDGVAGFIKHLIQMCSNAFTSKSRIDTENKDSITDTDVEYFDKISK